MLYMKNKSHERTHCRTEETKKKLSVRLRRIEGQVRAIEKMIGEDKPCIEILRLISSVSGALRGVWTETLGDHLKGCIRESLEQEDDSLVDELTDYLKKIR